MDLYDVIIVGAGPAGLSAAIYLARAQYRVLVVEKETFGGQITITSEVVNYPGIVSTDGSKLTHGMYEQAENFGAEFLKGEVVKLELAQDKKKVYLRDGRSLEGLGVVLAMGASPRTAGFKGEIEFRGRGVAYCATCDGEFFTDRDIFVVGGGFAAAEEAMFLTKYGKSVTVLVRSDKFSCAQSVVDKLLANEKIKVMYNTEITEVGGDGFLQYALLKNNADGVLTRYEAGPGNTFGIFVFAGYAPATDIVRGAIELDKSGYLICGKNQKTSLDGVYGAGDICVKNLRQVVTAVSDGAVAATELEKHVSAAYEKLRLPPREPLKKPRRGKTPPGESAPAEEGAFLSDAVRGQLEDVFAKLEREVVLKALLDDRPISAGVKAFLSEACALSPLLSCSFERAGGDVGDGLLPEIRLETADGYSGISFHGVPGGHEINSFVVAIYNLAGPGQFIEESVRQRIAALDRPLKLVVAATLSCTMCPGLVMSSQRIASLNPLVEAHMVDLNLFPELKDEYNIMSVPAMLINGEGPLFGKKDLTQLLEILEEKLQKN